MLNYTLKIISNLRFRNVKLFSLRIDTKKGVEVMSEEVFELCLLESDEEIQKFCSEKGVAMLALIAPHIPYRMSPSRVLRVELDTPE